MIALDMRAVVWVDGRPAAAGPGAPVSHGVVRSPDPRPVDFQRATVVAGDTVAYHPALDGHPPGAPVVTKTRVPPGLPIPSQSRRRSVGPPWLRSSAEWTSHCCRRRAARRGRVRLSAAVRPLT